MRDVLTRVRRVLPPQATEPKPRMWYVSKKHKVSQGARADPLVNEGPQSLLGASLALLRPSFAK